MKKSILVLGLVATLLSCTDKGTTAVSEQKTAYIDTQKLMKEYEETKDIEAKYKIKSDEMGKELEGDISRFQADAQNFQREAQAKGMAWAQQKGAELQRREQDLSAKQQGMLQALQLESGKEMDSLVKKIKTYVKDYGKKNGYAYIYGTEDASTILYAKEEFDLTDKVIKDLNSKYKGTATTAETKDEKDATTKK
ncbi:OmpH family outer membrane protein [Flavobacterium sp. JP2137]|uniref:OmpH family outer membrane protein n=1 Tax=Flavobacterium sp. JP2137 TaxID=3414510 RepID=UPI003D3003B5